MAIMAATALVSAGAVTAGVAATTIMIAGAVATVVGAVTKSKLLMKIGSGATLGAGAASAFGLGAETAATATTAEPALGAAQTAQPATGQQVMQAASQNTGQGTLQAQASLAPAQATEATTSNAVLDSAGMAAKAAKPVSAAANIGGGAQMSGKSWLADLYGQMDAGDKAIVGKTIQGAATGAANYMAASEAEKAKRAAIEDDIKRRSSMPSIVQRYNPRPVIGA